MQKSNFLMLQKDFGVFFRFTALIIAVHLQNVNVRFHKVV